MIIKLGVVAGRIWKYLEENKKAPLSELVSVINTDRDRVLMGLGWMVREGHAILEKTDGEYIVSLRKA